MISNSIKKLTDFIRRFAHSPLAPLWLFLYSVVESIIIPIPPDVMLAPMAMAYRKRAFFFATIAALGSTIGGLIGYGIGYLAFETVASPVLHWLCQFIPTSCPELVLPRLQHLFAQYGIGVVALSSMAPLIPYRFTILAAGLGHMALVPFVVVSLVAHWVRYMVVAALSVRYGHAARLFVTKKMSMGLLVAIAIALALYFIFQ